jgi:hypothetical protein
MESNSGQLKLLDKSEIKKSLILELQNQILLLRRSVDTAMDATTHEDAKAEGKYDTRAIESGYLAEAQAKRLNELERKLAFLQGLKFSNFKEDDEIAATALVGLGSRWFLILPKIGGFTIEEGEIKVFIVTPESGVGKKLIGSYVGDEIGGEEVRQLL